MGQIMPATLAAMLPEEADRPRRINHPECPAGVDRKRRLFIVRTARGGYAHCWHCGGEWYTRNILRGRAALDALDIGRHAPAEESAAGQSGADIWDAMPRMTLPTLRGPGTVELFDWMRAKRLPVDTVRVLRMPRAMELRVPIYTGEPARVVGYQSRQFGPGARRAPKYMEEHWTTARGMPALLGLHDSPPWGGRWLLPRAPLPVCFVVESFADAVYLAERGHIAAPIYGNKLDDRQLFRMATFPALLRAPLIVWLDNDKPEIKERAQQMARTLGLYGPAVAWVDISAPTDTPLEMIAAKLKHASD